MTPTITGSGASVSGLKVDSRRRWVATPVWVLPGDIMTFEASGVWGDFTIPCSADGWHADLFYAIGKLPRIIDDKRYFRLMGRISESGDEPATDEPERTFVIGRARSVTADWPGRLYVFANDRAGFYWNNWGHVLLNIALTRQTDT